MRPQVQTDGWSWSSTSSSARRSSAGWWPSCRPCGSPGCRLRRNAGAPSYGHEEGPCRGSRSRGLAMSAPVRSGWQGNPVLSLSVAEGGAGAVRGTGGVNGVGASVRVAGEEPCASARMRCFIVGGSARSRGRVHRTEGAVGVAAVAPLCSWLVAAGSVTVASVAAAAELARPSDARSAKNAVMKAVQRLFALKVLMAPHFQVVRFAYFPDHVDPARDFRDRRRRYAVLQMNTTRMVQPVPKCDARGVPRGAVGTFGRRCTIRRRSLVRRRQLGCGEVTGRYRPMCIVGQQNSPMPRKDEVAR